MEMAPPSVNESLDPGYCLHSKVCLGTSLFLLHIICIAVQPWTFCFQTDAMCMLLAIAIPAH